MNIRPFVIIAAVTMLFSLSGCEKGDEKNMDISVVSIKASDVQIPYIIETDLAVAENFGNYMKQISYEDIPYIELNKEISLDFNGIGVTSIEIKDSVLNQDGTLKYTTRETIDRKVDLNNGNLITFQLENHRATAFSSNLNDYKSGNSIRGFRMRVMWNDKQYLLSFVVRSDSMTISR